VDLAAEISSLKAERWHFEHLSASLARSLAARCRHVVADTGAALAAAY